MPGLLECGAFGPTVSRVTRPLRVVFDALPLARWGPLFHLLRVEQPDTRLHWQAVGFPSAGRSLLAGADVGLFVAPAPEPGARALTIETSPMVVAMAAGHHLAFRDELTVGEVLDEPFPGGPTLNPQWRAFWTLDDRRGGPPRFTDDDVRNVEQGLHVVAGGRAIATCAATIANGLAHPGVVALPLVGGPSVPTRLVWRTEAEHPALGHLIDLALAMTMDVARSA
jgi:DNA-binding transcriptional LysR family regulator